MAADIPIRDVMTRLVQTVPIETTLEKAQEIMREHKIRHLPVLDGHRLVGLVSLRELALLRAFPIIDMCVASVADAMAEDVYTVGPDERLQDVCRTMAEKKYGSTIVMEGGVVLGIFTTVDALRVVSRFL